MCFANSQCQRSSIRRDRLETQCYSTTCSDTPLPALRAHCIPEDAMQSHPVTVGFTDGEVKSSSSIYSHTLWYLVSAEFSYSKQSRPSLVCKCTHVARSPFTFSMSLQSAGESGHQAEHSNNFSAFRVSSNGSLKARYIPASSRGMDRMWM